MQHQLDDYLSLYGKVWEWYPHYVLLDVRMDHPTLAETAPWCQEQFGLDATEEVSANPGEPSYLLQDDGRWTQLSRRHFHFRNEDDALLFKLRFVG